MAPPAGRGWTRRQALIAAVAAGLAPGASRAQRVRRRSRLILLGTKGGPTRSPGRAPAANLLIVDGEPFVVDCPDGVARQLVLAGVDLARLRHLFLTHLHSDHAAGLGALLLLAWGSGLREPLTAYGPPPLARSLQLLIEASAPDIEARMREEGRPALAPLVLARELAAPGPVLATANVRVTCARVDHYSVPAFAYRFDTPDRSFVFSGDTRPSDALIALARGADVLVHEAMLLDAIAGLGDDGNAPALREHLLRSHTTTEELGRVAAAAGVGTVVLSHLVPAFPRLTDAMWIAGVRRHFHGRIVVGRDLMEI
jgi:ribonuclease BN (tRNA processing enzyme)